MLHAGERRLGKLPGAAVDPGHGEAERRKRVRDGAPDMPGAEEPERLRLRIDALADDQRGCRRALRRKSASF